MWRAALKHNYRTLSIIRHLKKKISPAVSSGSNKAENIFS